MACYQDMYNVVDLCHEKRRKHIHFFFQIHNGLSSNELIKLRKLFEIVSDILILHEIEVLFVDGDEIISELFETNTSPCTLKLDNV